MRRYPSVRRSKPGGGGYNSPTETAMISYKASWPTCHRLALIRSEIQENSTRPSSGCSRPKTLMRTINRNRMNRRVMATPPQATAYSHVRGRPKERLLTYDKRLLAHPSRATQFCRASSTHGRCCERADVVLQVSPRRLLHNEDKTERVREWENK